MESNWSWILQKTDRYSKAKNKYLNLFRRSFNRILIYFLFQKNILSNKFRGSFFCRGGYFFVGGSNFVSTIVSMCILFDIERGFNIDYLLKRIVWFSFVSQQLVIYLTIIRFENTNSTLILKFKWNNSCKF